MIKFTETKSLLLLVHADDTMLTTYTKDKNKSFNKLKYQKFCNIYKRQHDIT